MKKKILLIGPFPEPKGGVSIHVQRLSKLLSISHDVLQIDESPIKKTHIFNIRSLNIIKYLSLIYQSNIVHIQSSIDIFRIIHIIISRIFNKKIILTIHSWRNKSNYKKKIFLLCINFIDEIIIVNQDIAVDLNLKKYSVKPAFLPPGNEELNILPKDLEEIIAQRKKDNYYIVSSNAYQLVDYNGVDLYGLDLFINLAEAHKDKNIFFIFQLATVGKNDLARKYNKYVEILKNKKLKNVLLYVNPISFVALISQSDLTLRLTNTDGDAVSIRESLYLNTPIIASDVVTRPRGTVLFKNRDFNDLNTVFNNLLNKSNSDKVNFNFEQDSSQSFVDFYNNVYFE